MRSHRLHLTSLTFAASCLALPGIAQQTMRSVPIPGPIKNAGTYHVATGEWSRAHQTYGLLAQDALYRNDLASGYFGQLDQSETASDEGRLPGLGEVLLAGQPETGTADDYHITGFQIGYCALNPNPTTYTLTFREAYAPCNDPANFPVLTTFVNSGLPNSGCWVVAFDLSGSSFDFSMAAEGGDGSWDNDNDLDDFGYSLTLDNGQGDGIGSPTAGPILAGRTDLPLTQGDGTVFKNPTLSGTGLGSEDLFWLNSSNVADGCYFFGGCNPCANFNLTLFGFWEGPPPFCSASANSVAPGGADLVSTGGLGTAAASFTITNTPNQPGLLYAGPNAINLPFGCGTRCIGGQVARYGVLFPVGNTVSTTVDMTVLPGLNHIQYWYRDPANFGACGDVFNLSNGL